MAGMRGSFLAVCCLGLLAAGCAAVGPDYKGPDVTGAADAPADAWHGVLPHEGRVSDLTGWWAQFDDPAVAALVARAEHDDPGLEADLARIRQARASLAKTAAALIPGVSGSGNASRSGRSSGGDTDWTTSGSAGLDAAWELDLFGGKRRAVEQTRAQLQSKLAGWHDVRVTLAAEVADTYVVYRACERVLAVDRQKLESQIQTRDLVAYKVEAGLAPASDGDLSRASVMSTMSGIENQSGACAQYMNALVALTGIPAAEIEPMLAAARGAIPSPHGFEIDSIPARVIAQRPDIAEAERNLAAASAAIGVAEAARYPSFSLTGSIGISRSSGDSTVSSWGFGPALSVPVFNAGALSAEAARTRAVYEETQAAYRQAVRGAVHEVEDALSRLSVAGRRLTQAEMAVDEYRSYLRAIEAGYEAGTSSLLDLEDTRRTVYGAEDTLIAARQERVQAWIALYKAAGGGWNGELNVKGAQ